MKRYKSIDFWLSYGVSNPSAQTQSPPAEMQSPPIENFLATVLCRDPFWKNILNWFKTGYGWEAHHQKVFNWETTFVQRGLTLLNLTKNPLIYSVSYFNFGGLVAFLGGLRPPNPRGDETGYQKMSVSKTVLPNHAGWDIGLLDAQQWLKRLTFDGYCDEELYSVHHCKAVQPFRLTLFLL